MKRRHFAPLILLLALTSVAIGAAIYQTSTLEAQFTYQVPPGVVITVMADTWDWPDFVPACDNWPNTPTVLPCVVEIHAVATDDLGAQATAVQRWLYQAPPTPTPTPTPSPTPRRCIKINPVGKCTKYL
jgi:hypothetical protein